MKIGNLAPKFSLPTDEEETFKLTDMKGKYVVLYFYPRDNTPGCTQESKDFHTHYAKFKKLNAEVIGISRDTVASHQKFKSKFKFKFNLLADEDEIVCNKYEVMKEKNMYGKKVMGIERSTFLIGPNGKLLHEWRKVKVPGHVEEVLDVLKESLCNG